MSESNTPTAYYIVAFDEAYMERLRAFRGKRPGHLFVEPVTEPNYQGKYRIARLRDDGTKLYYVGPGAGSWFRRGGNFFDTSEEADTILERLEWLAGRPGYYGHTSNRCFGVFYDGHQAIEAVEHNSMDMHEFKYTWIVIQKAGGYGIHPGFDAVDDDQMWFKWAFDENLKPHGGKWARTPKPEETGHILSFAPVG